MLVQDTERIRKTRIWDRILKQHHLNLQLVNTERQQHCATVSPDGEADVTNPEQRMGQVLERAELERRLKLANPNLYFETSKNDPSKVGVYIPGRDLRSGKVVKRYLCGMEAGFSPEFSVINPEPIKVADGNDRDAQFETIMTFSSEKRGWRTVIARLLELGVITRGQVDKHFPTYNGNSLHWQQKVERV